MKSVCVSYYYHRHSRRDMLLALPPLLAVVTTVLTLAPTISQQQQDSNSNFSSKQNFDNYKTTLPQDRPLVAKSRPRLIDLMDNFTNSRRDNEGEAGGTDVLRNKSLSSTRPPGSRTTTDSECQGQKLLEYHQRKGGNPSPCQTAGEDLFPVGDGNSIRIRGGSALLFLGPNQEKIRDIIEKSPSRSTITTVFPGVSSDKIGGIRKPSSSTVSTVLPGLNSEPNGQIKKHSSSKISTVTVPPPDDATGATVKVVSNGAPALIGVGDGDGGKFDGSFEGSGLEKIIGKHSNGDDDEEFNRNNLIELWGVSHSKSDEGGEGAGDKKLERNESEMSSEGEDFKTMDHSGGVPSRNGSQSIPYTVKLTGGEYVPVQDRSFHRADILQSASLKLETNGSILFPSLRLNQSIITSWSTQSPGAAAPPVGEGGFNEESSPSRSNPPSTAPSNYDDYYNAVGERRLLSPGSITGGGGFPTTMSTSWVSAELDNRQTEASSTSTTPSPFGRTSPLGSDVEENASSIRENRVTNTSAKSSFHTPSVGEEVEATTWRSGSSLQPVGEQTLSQFSTGTNLVAADVELHKSMPRVKGSSSNPARLGESALAMPTAPYYGDKFRLGRNDGGSALSTVALSTTTNADTMQKDVHPTKPKSYGNIAYFNKTQRHPMNPIANLRSHLNGTPSLLLPQSLKTSSTTAAPNIWTPYYTPDAYLFPTVNKVTRPSSSMDDEDLSLSFSYLNNSANSDSSSVFGVSKVIQQQEIPWPVKKEAVVEGDLVLGGLMMVHEREDTITCGPVMPQGGIQALEAMLYTLDRLNFAPDPLLPNITLGAHILDDCDKDTYGLEMAVDFIKGRILLFTEESGAR